MPLALLLAAVQIADPLAVVDDAVDSTVNVLHYRIEITVPDTGTEIAGRTTLHYMLRARSPLHLDFDRAFEIGTLTAGEAPPQRLEPESDWWWADDGSLVIDVPGTVGDTLAVTVPYRGSPSDGLYLQDNVYGNRTVFADNWPNRARRWFPGIDHPSDKATVEFLIEIPSGWRAVANGRLAAVDTLATGRTRWHWRETQRIPVYTMVIGAGPLVRTDLGHVVGVPHTLWTFPRDSAFAVAGPFRRVNRIVEEFTRLVGPFPYEKLAHVESSTRFGGMENSSAIFYDEDAYAERRMGEGLVAHETAHQWFGDAVTEFDWHHLWLSEGFATYFAALFYQLIGEDETFRERLARAKDAYLRSDVVDRPVIDTAEQRLFDLLNANNYPKGAWILHMLRGEVGDATFFRGLRSFYTTFRDSTALSSDLAAVMGRAAGRSLDWFFRQWLLQPGYPQVEAEWRYDADAGRIIVAGQQVQPDRWGVYRLVVPVRIRLEDESVKDVVLRFDSRVAAIETNVPTQPRTIEVDPDHEVLLTVNAVRKEGSR